MTNRYSSLLRDEILMCHVDSTSEEDEQRARRVVEARQAAHRPLHVAVVRVAVAAIARGGRVDCRRAAAAAAARRRRRRRAPTAPLLAENDVPVM